jgi:ABC-type multidrug transport system fused ATPase/permease subunit
MNTMRFRNPFPILKKIVLAPVILAVFSAIVMFLWNILIPDIFGLTAISFWQALGLLLLSRILFGGFIGRGAHRRKKMHNRMREKWMNMSSEERENFFEKRRKAWGRRHGPWHHRHWEMGEEEKPPQDDE